MNETTVKEWKKDCVDVSRMFLGIVAGVVIMAIGVAIWASVVWVIYHFLQFNKMLTYCSIVFVVALPHIIAWRMNKTTTTGAAAICKPAIVAIIVFPTTLIYAGGFCLGFSVLEIIEIIKLYLVKK